MIKACSSPRPTVLMRRTDLVDELQAIENQYNLVTPKPNSILESNTLTRKAGSGRERWVKRSYTAVISLCWARSTRSIKAHCGGMILWPSWHHPTDSPRDPVDVEEAIASSFPSFPIRRVECNWSWKWTAGERERESSGCSSSPPWTLESSAQPPPPRSGQTPH